MSINRWVDEEAVVHIYIRILLSHKKECIWVSSNEVDETRAFYVEWSNQKEKKHISYSKAYMWNLERILMDLFAGQWRPRLWEQTCRNGAGEGEVGLNGESSMGACTLPFIKQMGICYMTQETHMRLCDNLEVWVGVGRRLKREGHMYTYVWFLLLYGRNQHNIVKQLSFN